MPTYDYCCEQNSRVVEVEHRMTESVATWGELCARAGLAVGDTDPNAPVTRQIAGGILALPKRSRSQAPAKAEGGHTCGSCCGH